MTHFIYIKKSYILFASVAVYSFAIRLGFYYRQTIGKNNHALFSYRSRVFVEFPPKIARFHVREWELVAHCANSSCDASRGLAKRRKGGATSLRRGRRFLSAIPIPADDSCATITRKVGRGHRERGGRTSGGVKRCARLA